MFLVKLFQCFFCWQVNLPERSDEAEAICACTFGRGDDSCNKAMACHVQHRASHDCLPYCVQGEIGHCIGQPTLFNYVSAESQDVHSRGYVGTHDTVREHVEKFLRPKGITKIHVEAHPHHAWRVVMCYRRLGIEVVSVCTEMKPYPRRSTQTWCRSAARFIPYEIAVRLVSLAKGYI